MLEPACAHGPFLRAFREAHGTAYRFYGAKRYLQEKRRQAKRKYSFAVRKTRILDPPRLAS